MESTLDRSPSDWTTVGVEIVGLERGSGPEALTCSMASVVSRPEGLRSRIAFALPVGLVPEECRGRGSAHPSSRSSSSLGSSRTPSPAMCYVPSRSGFGTSLLVASSGVHAFVLPRVHR